MCEICSKLTIKTQGQRHWHRSGVFIVNFEHISHLLLVFLKTRKLPIWLCMMILLFLGTYRTKTVEAYSESGQTTNMEHFPKIVYGYSR